MREYDYKLDKLFNGLSPYEINPKHTVLLLDCHNLEPTRNEDYKLHEPIVDLDADGYAWGNP